jgi:hypothetical protein
MDVVLVSRGWKLQVNQWYGLEVTSMSQQLLGFKFTKYSYWVDTVFDKSRWLPSKTLQKGPPTVETESELAPF